MDVLVKALYCFECSIQFDKKYVFDVHLSVVHGEKLDIKEEPDIKPLIEAQEKDMKTTDQELTTNDKMQKPPKLIQGNDN